MGDQCARLAQPQRAMLVASSSTSSKCTISAATKRATTRAATSVTDHGCTRRVPGECRPCIFYACVVPVSSHMCDLVCCEQRCDCVDVRESLHMRSPPPRLGVVAFSSVSF